MVLYKYQMGVYNYSFFCQGNESLGLSADNIKKELILYEEKCCCA